MYRCEVRCKIVIKVIISVLFFSVYASLSHVKVVLKHFIIRIQYYKGFEIVVHTLN